MKVLSLRINFLLPEEFKGNFNDALKELIVYREERGDLDFPPIDSAQTKKIMQSDHEWNRFLDNISKGYNLTGSIFLGEWKNGKWKNFRQGE